MVGLILGNLMFGVLGSASVEWSLISALILSVSFLNLFFFCLYSFTIIKLGLPAFLYYLFQDSPEFLQNPDRPTKFSWASSNPFLSFKLVFGTSPYIAILVFIYALNFVSLADVTTSSFLYHTKPYYFRICLIS